jgi:predicted ribonuclease toxin of YeeF-YezG toxin-antitoxin module
MAFQTKDRLGNMRTTLDSRVTKAVNTIFSNYGHLLQDEEVRDSFYMQELDSASSGDDASQKWLQGLDVDQSRYQNALDSDDPRPEVIQQYLVMWQTFLGEGNNGYLRRAVMDELMKEYPLNDR